MEIITKKHWLGFNSDDPQESDWALKSSTENFKIYEDRLEKLRSRLNKRNWEFFKDGLHDGQLVSYCAGDGVHLNFEKDKGLTLSDFDKTSVLLKVISKWFDAIYELKYEKVTRTVFDFPTDSPLFLDNKIGDWGYDELSEVDDHTFRHEILFSSGSTVLIDFERFSFKKTAYSGSRYKK